MGWRTPSLFEVRPKEGGFTLSLQNLCKIIHKENAFRLSICGLRALCRPSAPFVTHKGITTDKWPLFLLKGLRYSNFGEKYGFSHYADCKDGTA